MQTLCPTEAVPIVMPTADPFGLIRHGLDDPAMFKIVAIIDTSGEPRSAAEPLRCVCRTADGHLVLAEVAGREAVQIGAPVSFWEAGELATNLLGLESPALPTPHIVRTLAMAYLAALAVAEINRQPSAGTVAP